MTTEDMLNGYLSKTRARDERIARSEVIQRVERVFDELSLSWQRHSDGDGTDWDIDSDVGVITVGLDDDEEVLTFAHYIHVLQKSPKKSADYLYSLLTFNADAAGACFAIRESEELGAIVYVVGRLAAQQVDPGEVALTLANMLDMLGLFEPEA